MKKKVLSLVAGAMLLASSSVFASPNIVLNPGFESLTDNWTMSMSVVTGSSHTGSYSVGTGCVGHFCVSDLASGALVAQTLNTVAGATYDLSFWVGERGGANSELSVFWNGNMIADVLNPANNSLYGAGMVQYSYSGLVASSASTGLEVHGRQDPGAIYFDDFSVTATQAPSGVPEPASAAILLTGLGMMSLLARRKRG